MAPRSVKLRVALCNTGSIVSGVSTTVIASCCIVGLLATSSKALALQSKTTALPSPPGVLLIAIAATRCNSVNVTVTLCESNPLATTEEPVKCIWNWPFVVVELTLTKLAALICVPPTIKSAAVSNT